MNYISSYIEYFKLEKKYIINISIKKCTKACLNCGGRLFIGSFMLNPALFVFPLPLFPELKLKLNPKKGKNPKPPMN